MLSWINEKDFDDLIYYLKGITARKRFANFKNKIELTEKIHVFL